MYKTVISLENVGKQFNNDVIALEAISMSINEQEFVSLLGPSGCGKTTLLRLMAGLLVKTSGSIKWTNSTGVVSEAPNSNFGFVFQEPTLVPWFTVADNIALPQRLKGLPKNLIKEAVSETLELVGLSKFASVFPRQLSGGMKMRVSLARAISAKPNILLMDEPFAALDEISRHRLIEDVLRLKDKQKWTVVFVTHSVEESVYMSSRIIVMMPRPGRIFDEISIDVPYPRSSNFRFSNAEYTSICAVVHQKLQSAMGMGRKL